MPVKFTWESELPVLPPASQVQERFEYALTNFEDPRGLCPSVVSACLKMDPLRVRVVGIGYDDNKKRIVTFDYLLGDKTWRFDYYEDPLASRR